MGIQITMRGMPADTAKFAKAPDDQGVHRRRPRGRARIR